MLLSKSLHVLDTMHARCAYLLNVLLCLLQTKTTTFGSTAKHVQMHVRAKTHTH